MNRKNFLFETAAGISGLLLFPALANANADAGGDPEPYKSEWVKEFVIAGHGGRDGDLTKVESMIKDYPNVIYSKYDWGNGDFEDALEGAGHMGNKEIAHFLIDHGARTNIFVLCMLGKISKTDLRVRAARIYTITSCKSGRQGFRRIIQLPTGKRPKGNLGKNKIAG